MSYIRLSDGLYPVTERDIRAAHPNTSFPVPFVPPEDYALVFPSPQPEFDITTKLVKEVTPILTTKGHYEQCWEIVNIPTEQLEIISQAKSLSDSILITNKIDALWKAADTYVSGYISGVAIGILTIGVLQQKPKALAVTNWSSAVWAEYYVRKALVTSTSTDNHDFSSFGRMPYSVPELQEEIGLV